MGPGGLLGDLTRRLVERAMSAEPPPVSAVLLADMVNAAVAAPGAGWDRGQPGCAGELCVA